MILPPELLEFLAAHLDTLLRLSNPFFFNLHALSLAVLIIINPIPLRTHMDKQESAIEVALIWVRRLLVFTLVVLTFVMPFYIFSVFNLVNAETYKNVEVISKALIFSLFKAHWWRIIVGIVAGIVIKALYERYVAPQLSSWWRTLRVNAVNDKLSDVRETIGTLQTKSFNPTDYYKESSIFFGLGQNNEPLYLSHSLFKKTNIQIVGPTRFGKGVLLGALLDQCLRADHSVIYVDPKDDEWLPWILWHSTAQAKKRFVVVDLNADGKQRWHPFAGGSLRDRRARLIAACGLANAGTDADFYKRAERGIVDRILPSSSGSIASLLEALEAKDTDGTPLKGKAPSLYEGLKELSQVPALNPAKGGMSVADVLTKGWVWYFRGSLDDRSVLLATRLFIMEVIQEAKRLKAERSNYQLTLAVDELKFLISKELSDALATSLGHSVNMIVLHQSIEDLRGPEDKTLNVDALEKSVLINCQVKVLYKCDPETAEWGAKLSGTKMVESTRMQKMHINSFGGETFERERSVSLTEEGLIPENTLLTLSPMVGAFYTPHDLAKVIFTSPVPTQKGEDIFQENPIYTEWRMANTKREKGEQVPQPTENSKPVIVNDGLKATPPTQQPQLNKADTNKPAQPNQTKNKQSQPKPNHSQAGSQQAKVPHTKQTQNKPQPQNTSQSTQQKNSVQPVTNTPRQNVQQNENTEQPQGKSKPKPEQNMIKEKQTQAEANQPVDAHAKAIQQIDNNKQSQNGNKQPAQNLGNTTNNNQQKQNKQHITTKPQQNISQKPKRIEPILNENSSNVISPEQLMDPPTSIKNKPAVLPEKMENSLTPEEVKNTSPEADIKTVNNG